MLDLWTCLQYQMQYAMTYQCHAMRCLDSRSLFIYCFPMGLKLVCCSNQGLLSKVAVIILTISIIEPRFG